MAKHRIPRDLQIWIDARKRFKLSHAQVQMARELGLNPRKFGRLASHKQEPWKVPLPQFIEQIYLKRFGKRAPDEVVTIEERAQRMAEKKAVVAKADRRAKQETAKESIRSEFPPEPNAIGDSGPIEVDVTGRGQLDDIPF